MTYYKCNRCGKLFKLKGDHVRHINRKFPCKEIDPDISKITPGDIEITMITCNFCNTTFSRKYSLDRHLNENRCKIKNK